MTAEMTVDKGTRSRLLWGFLAQWVSKLSYTFIQLIQVPLFLHFWSEATYGDWIALSAIPNYLVFSNLGFGTVAENEMTMSIARGDDEAALRVFQSCWWLITLSLLVAGALAAAALRFIPIDRVLNTHAISPHDARMTIGYLGIVILLGQLEGLMQGAYRSVGRNPYGLFVKSMFVLVAFAATLIPVYLGFGPRTTALVYAATSAACTLTLGLMVRRDVPWLRYGWSHARLAEVKRLAFPAFAFMGFPMGLALNLQGTILVVSHVLGPIAVVIFATARTISRVALQMVQMINTTFEPEFSKSFAQRDFGLIRTLHRRACQSALILSGLIVTGMILAGPSLLHHWTAGKVPPSRPLLSILLVVIIVYSLWATSATILTATNQHKRLAAVYVAATACTIFVTWLATRAYGLYGAAASLLLSEIVMNLYVLPSTLKIAHDTFPHFLGSFFEIPPSFHPRALLRRLPRSRDLQR